MAPEHVRREAGHLFTSFCKQLSSAKLAAKIATIFNLQRDDLDDWELLVVSVQRMLQSQSSYKAAVHLLMQFEGLSDHVNITELLSQLVADGAENLAQDWAATLGKDYQVAFVEACVALERLKPAARAVRQLGLTAEFPNIESLYRQRSLARLVGKRLWQVALSFVGSDTPLQTQLVQDMADVGEVLLAEEYQKQLGLPESVLTISPAQLAAQESARLQQYLQLTLPPERLLFVDDDVGMIQASQLLSGHPVLGLDVEWKPSHTAGVVSPAAILQVASHDAAVVFDLIALVQQHPTSLDRLLGPLFADPDVLKLGFEVAGDLNKLCTSWPQVEAFKLVAGVLDLKPLWIALGLATKKQGASVRLLSAVGLSTLCKSLLGKPLDKSQQMSDWTVRPLMPRQLQYAALDAFVQPQLYDVFVRELGAERCQQLTKQHSFIFKKPGAATGTIQSPAAREQLTADDDESGLLGTPPPPPLPEAQSLGTWVPGGALRADADSHQQTNSERRSRLARSGGGGGGAATEQGNANLSVGSTGSYTGNQQGPAQVLAYLSQHGLNSVFRPFGPSSTAAGACAAAPAVATACATAAALGVPRTAVVKTMAVLVDQQQPWLVVTRGNQRLAARLGVRRRAVKIAPDAVVLEITGFKSTSGLPPIGFNVPVLIDQQLAAATAVRPPAHELPPACGSRQLAGSSQGTPVVVAVDAETACQLTDDGAGQAEATTTSGGDNIHAQLISQGASSILYVQCGPGGVLQLTFEQLLQLSGGTVADVAEAGVPPASASSSAAAAAASGAEGPDPHLSGGQQAVPRFLLDSMLGRLCRWLRVLGVDAEFGRLFLTRDTKLAMRRDVGGSVYLLHTDDAAEQLAEISKHFGVRFDESVAMSRCSHCNAAAFQQISCEAAEPFVPAHVLEVVDEFWQCAACGKVFWMGPKSYAALDLLSGLFENGQLRPTPLASTLPKC
eukprot:gene4540-4792_t